MFSSMNDNFLLKLGETEAPDQIPQIIELMCLLTFGLWWQIDSIKADYVSSCFHPQIFLQGVSLTADSLLAATVKESDFDYNHEWI